MSTPSSLSSTGDAPRVTISITDGIADVRLNRAEKRNALDPAMFQAIADAGARLIDEPRLRVVVLSGEGPSFCAGLDFSTFQAMAGSNDGSGGSVIGEDVPAGNAGSMTPGRSTHLGQQVAWVWQEVPVPVIAAVHGHALGGGLQIALGADLRLAHPDSQWAVREVHWGLVPDMTGTFILSGLVRPDVAKELTFTARIFDGREAAALGLVTRLSDDPRAEALAMAAEIAARSPGAIRGSKALFNRLAHEGAAEQFAAERKVIGEQIGSANQVEAVMAGFEKRAPVFAD
jgi:enoyl-CoA hydratase/carnithine racemase